MQVDATAGRKLISFSIQRLLYSIGLNVDDKCMQMSRKLLECFVSTPWERSQNLTLLLNAAAPMIIYPKTIDMTGALKLMAALHISKPLREKQLQTRVAEKTLRLLRDAQTVAVRRAKEGSAIQKLVTPAKVVEWMSAPMNKATDYADRPSEHKKPLVKLAKILLPVMCGYGDTAAAQKVLARLGVDEKEIIKMLGTAVVDAGAGLKSLHQSDTSTASPTVLDNGMCI
jgi:hypothetical protein